MPLSVHNGTTPIAADLAVVTIAMAGFQASALVESLRIAGRWHGPIYVLADSCDPGPVLTSDVAVVRVLKSQARDPLAAKVWKTRVFELVSEARVLFLDSDVQVMRPLPPFILTGPWASGCNAYFTHERWFVRDTTWNSGAALFDRRLSHVLLTAWRSSIASRRFVRDQHALKAVLQNGSHRHFTACQMPIDQVRVRYEADVVNHVWSAVAPRLYVANAPLFVHYTHEKRNVNKSTCGCARQLGAQGC